MVREGGRDRGGREAGREEDRDTGEGKKEGIPSKHLKLFGVTLT